MDGVSRGRGSPLGTLLSRSIDPSELGAPVDRRLVATSAGASVMLLGAAVIGRFWADPTSGSWIFFGDVVSWSLTTSSLVATPAGTVALALLALDAILASGITVGAWARGACIAQFGVAGLAWIPGIVLLALAVFTVVAYIALVIAVLAVAALLAVALLVLVFGGA